MKRLLAIPSVSEDELRLDFSKIEFLSVFEITELFFHIVANHEFGRYKIIGENNEVVTYLQRINFFYALGNAMTIPGTGKSSQTGEQARLIEMEAFQYKPEFETASKRLYAIFQQIGLSQETTSLIGASLSEVADNSFLHNLGKWPSKVGPLVATLIQQYPQKKELSISLCDFGVGFLRTLKSNYPKLPNEQAAIELALQPNTTSRAGHRGGNGLYFLRKSVFNGLRGALSIRSSDTLAQIDPNGKTRLLASGLPFSFGTNVEFGIKY
ncbi:MAG: hypothetical protein IPN19_04360 [Elusimicrobia bacterium]|nr:hypothetical protein [Elusimicrobiota bacterium]